MTPEETVRAYYDAVRDGDPLARFFVESPDVVKFGVGERLTGYAEIARGLREQTRTTEDWTLESDALRVVDRGEHAAFSDDVRMAWFDAESFAEHDYRTRWSGTLTRVDGESTWKFLGMHVSAEVDR
ncbi:nuclear transport factor 2 family protein [Halorarum halobium]|uniref:nuclear transport factor 2 family protein n=1 Tax=Halorarum halobium TaxID=3075121 RepID=UPI0028ABDDB2|nr:nuclear transport factor 2 family protein [Halobaculum sp. XH14]